MQVKFKAKALIYKESESAQNPKLLPLNSAAFKFTRAGTINNRISFSKVLNEFEHDDILEVSFKKVGKSKF